MARECGEAGCFDLQEVPPGSPLLAAAPPPWRRESCAVCPVITLPTSFEDFLHAIDPQLRTNIRRAENRLARAAFIEFATVERVPDLAETLFRLHSARWEERNDSGVLGSARLQAFHREVVKRFRASGILRLYGLLADSQCIAVQYNLSAKGRTYAYLSGFDPMWSRFSPGAVLLKYSIQRAIEEGSTEFDFLRKSEPFKYQFGTCTSTIGRSVSREISPTLWIWSAGLKLTGSRIEAGRRSLHRGRASGTIAFCGSAFTHSLRGPWKERHCAPRNSGPTPFRSFRPAHGCGGRARPIPSR